MPAIKIITTSDGSHSLLNTALDETYHSVHGAIQESQHVFIRHGFDCWFERNPKKEIRILEIGFGTGLNSFLTLLHSKGTGLKVYYESWDTDPFAWEVIKQLNYPTILGSPELFFKIHEAQWDQSDTINPNFKLQKRKADCLVDQFDTFTLFDLIYYDAFAPSKQPEMWTIDVLKKVTDLLSPGGIWVTYCAKGQVKRDLRSLGLTIETLSGPPGKKEMIRASRSSVEIQNALSGDAGV